MTSHATTSSAATSSSFARNPANAPSSGVPRPHIGTTCCWRSSTTPLLVHVAVEVDRELGQPKERAIDLDEPDFSRTQRDTTREAQIAVEPRVDQRAAVHVDAELAVARTADVGAGLDAQVRAVGVRADHDEPRSGVGGHVPRDDRAAPHHEGAARRTVDGLTERLPAEARFA